MSETYRAAVCTALSGPDAIEIRDLPVQRLPDRSVRIAVRAAGVNYPDYLLTRGEYQLRLDPPFTPGMEVAGTVLETSGASGGLKPGDPVIGLSRTSGFAEQVVVGAHAVLPLPAAFSFEEGACFMVAQQTAYHGAAGTKLLVVLAPWVLTLIPAGGYLGGWIPGGWRFVPTAYAAILLMTAALVLLVCPAPDRKPGAGRPLGELLAPLRFGQVWRFSLYYAVVFGAYVALSAWLPNYYKTTYHVELRTAALLTALYIFPASLLRPLGGWLADRFGPRVVTYNVFITMILALVPLCLPTRILDLGVVGFTALLVIVGAAMGIGKASVYKYVPDYYPNDVGAVGGLVGTMGALGGFLLPPAFGSIARWTGSPQSAFIVLLALAMISLAWLHLAVLQLRGAKRARAARPEIGGISTKSP